MASPDAAAGRPGVSAAAGDAFAQESPTITATAVAIDTIPDAALEIAARNGETERLDGSQRDFEAAAEQAMEAVREMLRPHTSATEEAHHDPDNTASGAARILIVDDDPIARRALYLGTARLADLVAPNAQTTMPELEPNVPSGRAMASALERAASASTRNRSSDSPGSAATGMAWTG